MNCPVCTRPMVTGTVIDGDSRHHYHTCPTCRARGKNVVALDTEGEQSANPTPDQNRNREVIDARRRLPPDSTIRGEAFAILTDWAAMSSRIIRRHGCGARSVPMLEQLTVGLYSDLRALLTEGGVL